jgi:DNA-binding GntR family transcriptional regulator
MACMRRWSQRTESVRQKAYQQVQRKILSGELKGGEALSEVALAAQFGISRTPIREAINQLVAEGFLYSIPNRGAVVVQLSKRDIGDLFEFREALEVFAAGKVAQKGVSAAEAQRLIEVADEALPFIDELRRTGQTVLNRRQTYEFMAADMAFHGLLIHSADNPRILKAVNDSRLLVRILAIHHDGPTAQQLSEIHRQHRAILDAIVRGSTVEAMDQIAEHIRHSLQERLEMFEDWESKRSLALTRAFGS